MTTDVSSSVSPADVVAPSAEVSRALGHSQGTDFYAIDDLLTADERAVRDRVRRFSDDEVIPVELAGITTFVKRSAVIYAQAQGDYTRLHTRDSNHLVRIPLSTLEERWSSAGFARIHRSTLVSLRHVTQVRTDKGHCSVLLGPLELQVSRRHTRALRDRLGRPGEARRRENPTA